MLIKVPVVVCASLIQLQCWFSFFRWRTMHTRNSSATDDALYFLGPITPPRLWYTWYIMNMHEKDGFLHCRWGNFNSSNRFFTVLFQYDIEYWPTIGVALTSFKCLFFCKMTKRNPLHFVGKSNHMKKERERERAQCVVAFHVQSVCLFDATWWCHELNVGLNHSLSNDCYIKYKTTNVFYFLVGKYVLFIAGCAKIAIDIMDFIDSSYLLVKCLGEVWARMFWECLTGWHLCQIRQTGVVSVVRRLLPKIAAHMQLCLADAYTHTRPEKRSETHKLS